MVYSHGNLKHVIKYILKEKYIGITRELELYKVQNLKMKKQCSLTIFNKYIYKVTMNLLSTPS